MSTRFINGMSYEVPTSFNPNDRESLWTKSTRLAGSIHEPTARSHEKFEHVVITRRHPKVTVLVEDFKLTPENREVEPTTFDTSTTNPASHARLPEKQADMDYCNPSWARFFLEQIHLKISAIEHRLEFLESSISKTEQDVNHLRETYARDEDEKYYWLTRVHAARRAIQDHRHFLGSTRRQLSVRRRSIHDALWAMEVLEEAGRVQAEVSAMYRAMNMCQQLFWDLGDEDVDVDAPHFIVKNYILELENLSSRLIST
ncbi:hypothetical protein M434DRAFT_30530 [Hypoxylon sp. CO27-5]|nr:hypothetical protein M434DRAFT_30530 [Hypoxylon sp. CO27-5]